MIILLLVLSMLFVCCDSEVISIEPTSKEENILSFKNSSATKGLSIDGENIKTVGESIHGVFIFRHENNSTFNRGVSTPNHAFNVQSIYNPYLDRWEISSFDAVWPNAPSSLLSFITYYPHVDSVTGDTFGEGEDATHFSIISESDDTGSPVFRYEAGNDVYYHQDILIGDSSPDFMGSLVNRYRLMSNPSVPFQFKHVTSSIEFSKKVVDADINDGHEPSPDFEFDILKITITGLENIGEFEMDVDEDPLRTNIPHLPMTPVIWSNLSGAATSVFVLNSDKELKEDTKQGVMVLNENYNITTDNGIIMIPPQSGNSGLKIIIEANITERVNGTISVGFWKNEFEPTSFNFEQGKRINYEITYNYEGPLTGSFELEGVIIPWITKDALTLPFF